MPPLEIYQCNNGHFVCEHCHAKLDVTNCRFIQCYGGWRAVTGGVGVFSSPLTAAC